ncbi:hypothetical protein Gorai_014747 [Gossypium raimondii]|uniref:CCHC-type domain-containing protein n=1 Tax=Gossypium raimondii TaxID=29730 RepID=A0A7J8P3T5_GOSRA|nr:hypothetical protein [Gossypium raimondii]
MFTKAIAKKFGDFIRAFVDYDVKAIAAGLWNYMQIRVKIDIRQSLKRKKKLIVAKKEVFATFKYERLTTLCFLCGKLGHSENYCPIRMVAGRKELPLEWDISLKAPPRWAAGTSGNEGGKGGKNLTKINPMMNNGANLGLNLYGKSKQILNEEDSKMDSMEIGPSEEDRPIISNIMKMLSWNIRGLGNPWFVRRIQHVLKKYYPQVVFFMEKKVERTRMERIKKKYGFVNGVDISAQGSRGSLSLSWCSSVNVTVMSFSENHIDVTIDNSDGTIKWRLTGFYGIPDS